MIIVVALNSIQKFRDYSSRYHPKRANTYRESRNTCESFLNVTISVSSTTGGLTTTFIVVGCCARQKTPVSFSILAQIGWQITAGGQRRRRHCRRCGRPGGHPGGHW